MIQSLAKQAGRRYPQMQSGSVRPQSSFCGCGGTTPTPTTSTGHNGVIARLRIRHRQYGRRVW